MGSVQPFPGKQAGTLADVWRLASLGAEPPRVRNTRREDYAAIRAVQRDSSPHVPPWSLRQLEAQVHAFPQGQLVAIADGDVAGASAALVVTWNEHEMGHTWRSITADGTFATHQGAGDTLYCAAMVTDPSRRGFGVARTLAQAQRRLCRRLNLRRIITTARLAGYAPHASEMAVEDYARRVVWGEIEDAGLRFRPRARLPVLRRAAGLPARGRRVPGQRGAARVVEPAARATAAPRLDRLRAPPPGCLARHDPRRTKPAVAGFFLRLY
jgi:GNAT superfamily N-acetyltransferase